jgi:Flp pilus assembly pilin Flp
MCSHLFGEFDARIIRTRDGRKPPAFDDCDIERTRRRGHATKQDWRSHVVAEYAAESQKFEPIANAPHASSRPEPVASTVASFDCSKGGEEMTFSEWFEYARTSWKKEDGQTMAEYGVVLAVITLGIVGTLTLLSGGINGALNSVISKL